LPLDWDTLKQVRHVKLEKEEGGKNWKRRKELGIAPPIQKNGAQGRTGPSADRFKSPSDNPKPLKTTKRREGKKEVKKLNVEDFDGHPTPASRKKKVAGKPLILFKSERRSERKNGGRPKTIHA